MTENNRKPRGKRSENMPKLDQAVAIVRPLIEAGKRFSPHALEKRHGISHVTFDMAVAWVRGYRTALADPPIDPSALAPSAKEKFDSAIRQHKKKLDVDYKELARQQAVKLLEETMLPATQRRHAEYSAVIKARKGALSEREYRVLLRVAHPDTRASASPELLREAYEILEARKLVLVAEKENPTTTPKIPTTDDVMRGWR